MDAVKFLKEKNRMCASFNSGCDGCPYADDSPYDFCTHKYINAPDKAVEIVEKWSSEHPVMTNLMKFEEVFGKCNPEVTAPISWWSKEYKEPKGE